MRNIKKIIIIGFISFINGCGSSGSSTTTGIDSIDNSKLNDGENTMGYYGEQVKFGNQTAARRWTYTAKTDNSITYFIFSIGDEGYIINNTQYYSFDYGFSQNGKLVNFIFDGHNWSLELLNTTTDYCYDAKVLLKDDGQYSTGTICAEK